MCIESHDLNEGKALVHDTSTFPSRKYTQVAGNDIRSGHSSHRALSPVRRFISYEYLLSFMLVYVSVFVLITTGGTIETSGAKTQLSQMADTATTSKIIS